MAKKSLYNFDDITPVQQECLTLIESLGIYELRALARVFGDNSPTTLKRDEHIVFIMGKIISGEELRPLPLRQGRPYKELSNIEGILAQLSQITGKDYCLKTRQNTNYVAPNVVVFRQVVEDIVEQRLFPIEVCGILKERNENEFYFISNTNGKRILVRKDLDFRLQPYDFVVGTAVVMNEEKEYMLDSVQYINYKSASSYQNQEDNYLLTLPKQKLKLKDAEIVLGGRYLLNEKIAEQGSLLSQNLRIFNENKIVTFALVPNVFYEDRLSIDTIGFNNSILISYDEKPSEIFEKVSLLLQHINRLQQLGFSVVLYVEDLITIANAIDFLSKNSKELMGHSETAVETIKQIVMLAKAAEKDKSTTIIASFNEADMSDPLFVSSVFKVFKKLK